MNYFEVTLHVGILRLIFHLNLQYMHLYLTLLIKILGLVEILALVLTFINWDFGD
jgi:hypothetical protein